MERKIGEIFDYKGKILKVVKNDVCIGCYFKPLISCDYIKKVTGFCSRELRVDCTDVIFKEVKK